MKTGHVCFAALAFSSASGSLFCNSVTESVMQTTVDGLLEPATSILNAAWPTIASKGGLDPMTAVKDYDYSIGGDAKDACKAVCGAQLASCHAFKIHVDSAVVHGMKNTTFGNIEASDVRLSDQDADVQATCDMEVDASAAIGTSLTVDLDVGGLRVWCKNAFTTWSELLWKGQGTCKASTKNATVSLTLEGSVCNPLKTKNLLAIDAATVNSVDLNLDNLDCDFNQGSGIPNLPDIVDFFAPNLFESVANSLKPAVATAITNAIEDGVLAEAGIPEQCGASLSEIVV